MDLFYERVEFYALDGATAARKRLTTAPMAAKLCQFKLWQLRQSIAKDSRSFNVQTLAAEI